DGGAGVGAAQDAGVQQPGAVDVVAVPGAPGGLVGAVEARDLGADESALLRPRHGLAPPFLVAQRVNGVTHLFVGATAADVAGQAALDLGGRGPGVGVEDGAEGDDKAGRAEAALLGVV